MVLQTHLSLNNKLRTWDHFALTVTLFKPLAIARGDWTPEDTAIYWPHENHVLPDFGGDKTVQEALGLIENEFDLCVPQDYEVPYYH